MVDLLSRLESAERRYSISSTTSFSGPRGPFLERIQRISHAIKFNEPIRDVDPHIFSDYGPEVLASIERNFEQMKEFALTNYLPRRFRNQFRIALETARAKNSFDPVSKAAHDAEKKGVHPYLLSFLGNSASRYISAMSSIDFIRKELIDKKRSPIQLAKFLAKNSKAGHHLAGLQSDFDFASHFETLKDELKIHELLLPRINGLTMRGLRHDFAIGNKQTCMSYFPSVYGGDNFNLAQFPGGKPGNHKYLITNFDHEGHGMDYITSANHDRHYTMGSDDALTRSTSSNGLHTDAEKENFLRDYLFAHHMYLMPRRKKTEAIAMIYDESTRTLHYAVAGHPHPTIYDPKQGLLPKPENMGELLGIDRKEFTGGLLDDLKPDEIQVHKQKLEKGMAVTFGTDGIREISPVFGKPRFRFKDEFDKEEDFHRYVRQDSGNLDIGSELDDVFKDAANRKLSPEKINRLMFQYAYSRRGVPFLADDSRQITLVAT